MLEEAPSPVLLYAEQDDPRAERAANVCPVTSLRGPRESIRPVVVGAVLGAVVGAVVQHRLRMTVPHGCWGGCGPDYGISGIVAGAVWARSAVCC